MQVALAIVSQDPKMRTSKFRFDIRRVANARARVTANGRPSGTATTTNVTDMIRMSIKDSPYSLPSTWGSRPNLTKKRIINAMNMRMPAAEPSLDIISASWFNLVCSGVSSGSSRSDIINLPFMLKGPTAVTTKSPTPSRTLEPEIINTLL